MAQLFKILCSILIIFLTCCSSQAALNGAIDYKIPVEYKNMNEAELNSKAELYYNNALKTTDKKLNDDISEALILYTMLENKNPNNVIYPLRVGSLYDLIGKDRYAKGNYYRAMGINPSRPEPYFYLGEFFFKRQQYRRALKMYNKAYDLGYSSHATTIARLKELSLILADPKIAR